MYFAAFPPEINSALMYSGAGASPMLGAATAWDGLASDLSSSAAQYASVIGSMDGVWVGPSAEMMSTSATRYLSWLTETAAQAELSATQARIAAEAFQTAHAATVAPPLIAANRTQLSVLVATNFLGINTAAIAAVEAEYAEMWAQDVAAMFGYQAASQGAVSGLPQFTPAPQTTTGTPAANTAISAASSGGWNIFAPGSGDSTTGLSGFLNMVSGSSNSAFGNLINSTVFNDFASSGLVNPGETLAPIIALAALLPAFQQMNQSLQGGDSSGGSGAGNIGGVGSGVDSVASGEAAAAGSLGEAQAVGGLSVPPSWQNTASAPLSRPLGSTPIAPMPGMMPIVPGNQGKGHQWGQPKYGVPTNRKIMSSHPSAG